MKNKLKNRFCHLRGEGRVKTAVFLISYLPAMADDPY